MPLHHLMIGTWTPPGAIFTVQFDDEALTLKLVKRTAIPEDEPISWMAFDVRLASSDDITMAHKNMSTTNNNNHPHSMPRKTFTALP